MAFDDVPGHDPRGPVCPRCDRPILDGQPRTLVHTFDQPPRYWHGECARPLWDTISSVVNRLNRTWGT